MERPVLRPCPMCGGMPTIASHLDDVWHDDRMYWWEHSCNEHVKSYGFRHPHIALAEREWNQFCVTIEED